MVFFIFKYFKKFYLRNRAETLRNKFSKNNKRTKELKPFNFFFQLLRVTINTLLVAIFFSILVVMCRFLMVIFLR